MDSSGCHIDIKDRRMHRFLLLSSVIAVRNLFPLTTVKIYALVRTMATCKQQHESATRQNRERPTCLHEVDDLRISFRHIVKVIEIAIP